PRQRDLFPILHLEIKVMVVAAARIERCLAGRAGIIAIEIAPDAHLRSAGAAEHGRFIPLSARPWFERVIRQRLMAILAAIIYAAALHLDGDDVARRLVVR